mmetsp:Transcript_10096/g.21149  ORF Transcript_10096/g.21149 Transcript_10096/m.21149 type:complete len:156 (+) Transcript_10096:358-825(+)
MSDGLLPKKPKRKTVETNLANIAAAMYCPMIASLELALAPSVWFNKPEWVGPSNPAFGAPTRVLLMLATKIMQGTNQSSPHWIIGCLSQMRWKARINLWHALDTQYSNNERTPTTTQYALGGRRQSASRSCWKNANAELMTLLHAANAMRYCVVT